MKKYVRLPLSPYFCTQVCRLASKGVLKDHSKPVFSFELVKYPTSQGPHRYLSGHDCYQEQKFADPKDHVILLGLQQRRSSFVRSFHPLYEYNHYIVLIYYQFSLLLALADFQCKIFDLAKVYQRQRRVLSLPLDLHIQIVKAHFSDPSQEKIVIKQEVFFCNLSITKSSSAPTLPAMLSENFSSGNNPHCQYMIQITYQFLMWFLSKSRKHIFIAKSKTNMTHTDQMATGGVYKVPEPWL